MAKRIQLTREEWHSMDLQPPCHYCKHLISYGTQRNDDDPRNSLKGWVCKAFPEEIPYDILKREVTHDNPDEPDLGQVDETTFYESKVYQKTAGPAKMSWDGYWVEAD